MATRQAPPQSTRLTLKQSAATFALSIFIGSAFYLHWRRGGLEALLSLKALAFFAAGIVLTPLLLGAAFHEMNRSFITALTLFAPAAASAQLLGVRNVLGTALLAGQVVIGYLFTQMAFLWVYY